MGEEEGMLYISAGIIVEVTEAGNGELEGAGDFVGVGEDGIDRIVGVHRRGRDRCRKRNSRNVSLEVAGHEARSAANISIIPCLNPYHKKGDANSWYVYICGYWRTGEQCIVYTPSSLQEENLKL